MVKKIGYTFLLLLLLLCVGFFFAAGRIVDAQMNVLVKKEHEKPSQAILEIHNDLRIADWHADNLLWDRNPLQRSTHGHVDVPKLIEGNVSLQVFDAVIKTPKDQNNTSNTGETDNITTLAIANRWPTSSWTSLCNRALFQSRKLHFAESNSEGKLKIIKTSKDLQELLLSRENNKDQVGGILAIEGLHALEGELNNLDRLFESGYRVMGLTHFFDNELGGSSAGVKQGGLTNFGIEVIKRMEKLGIVVDLAHASPELIDDVLQLSTRPVVVSHTGVTGTYNSPGNLTDDQLTAIAANKGVVGIGFWDGAVGDYRLRSIVKALRHAVKVMGIDHVCLGSNWDGGTTVYFDAAHLYILTKAMVEGGFSKDEIRAIMGENQLRFLKENLPKT